jgi:parallel beta-helix repeat protein
MFRVAGARTTGSRSTLKLSGSTPDLRRLAKHFLLPLTLLTTTTHPDSAHARTWRVTTPTELQAPVGAIQAAINNATSGDVILVSPGTYYENIDFMGKNITLRSEAGPEATIINGSTRDSSVVVFKRGETRAAVLEGFTITGGRGSRLLGSDKFGGGICVLPGGPSIIGNIIRNNSAIETRIAGRVYGEGGAIGMGSSAGTGGITYYPYIAGNVIEDNQSGSNGAGITLVHYLVPEVRNNIIRRNSTTYGDGGGIRLFLIPTGLFIISNNTIESNVAADHGGGIFVWNAHPALSLVGDISYNIIWRNTAVSEGSGDSGGGIWMGRTDATVRNNTIVYNIGLGGEFWGGGIALCYSGAPTIARNIIAGNSGGGILCKDETAPIIEDNLGWQNSPGQGWGLCLRWESGGGNVIADPLFCGADIGEFTLSSDSPALTHPAGVIGAISVVACEGTAVVPTTWSAIKARFTLP